VSLLVALVAYFGTGLGDSAGGKPLKVGTSFSYQFSE